MGEEVGVREGEGEGAGAGVGGGEEVQVQMCSFLPMCVVQS